MPTVTSDTGRTRWRARVKVDYVEYFLGNFPTREEAAQAEQTFRAGAGRA